jgi:hypothetical protein
MPPVREEAKRDGPRTGVLIGLAATRGVITSAGATMNHWGDEAYHPPAAIATEATAPFTQPSQRLHALCAPPRCP